MEPPHNYACKYGVKKGGAPLVLKLIAAEEGVVGSLELTLLLLVTD